VTLAHPSASGGAGLERSCDEGRRDWIRQSDAIGGVELWEARLQRLAYRRHRHDTYAISLTEAGVQAFTYRGEARASLPGQVVVLHPDEPHDGHAGTADGFRYRQLYIEPALIAEAVLALCGRTRPLPFAPNPVLSSATLARGVDAAFRQNREPLASDDLLVRIAEGLLLAERGNGYPLPLRRYDAAAIERARQFLDAETTRVIQSSELEVVTGLTRYELARQFRAALGTSPYRYSLMRRLAAARTVIAHRRPLVEVALEAGFADQAHFSRQFTAAYGLTPGAYSRLISRQPG
jgi:AraC-like DNA-binding protein